VFRSQSKNLAGAENTLSFARSVAESGSSKRKIVAMSKERWRNYGAREGLYYLVGDNAGNQFRLVNKESADSLVTYLNRHRQYVLQEAVEQMTMTANETGWERSWVRGLLHAIRILTGMIEPESV
jgi:hypothetical protein